MSTTYGRKNWTIALVRSIGKAIFHLVGLELIKTSTLLMFERTLAENRAGLLENEAMMAASAAQIAQLQAAVAESQARMAADAAEVARLHTEIDSLRQQGSNDGKSTASSSARGQGLTSTEGKDQLKRTLTMARDSRDPIIRTALEHYLAAKNETDPALPPIGSRWAPQFDRIATAINGFRDPIEAVHYAQRSITYDHREPIHQIGPLISLYDDLVRNEFPWFADLLDQMAEHPDSVAETLALYKGRNVSNILYWHARYVLCCLSHIPPPNRIFDIGGGYGAAARLWQTIPNAPESYCMIDTPESLFFAEVMLTNTFGNKVSYFSGVMPRTPIVLVPLCRFRRFPASADLVINTGSMQEMTDEWIDFYMQWLDEGDFKFFYSLNYVAQPIDRLYESRNLWAPRPSPSWATRYLSLNAPLVQAQARAARHFQEAIYERNGTNRTLSEWSALRGRVIDAQAYIEGLDLLRQSLAPETAKQFLRIVSEGMRYRPKEMLWVARWLEENGSQEFSALRSELEAAMGGTVEPSQVNF
jgi:putative sugar O-methyltransferase